MELFVYQSIHRFDENNADTSSTIGTFLNIVGTFLSIIGPLSGNLRIALLAKFGIIYKCLLASEHAQMLYKSIIPCNLVSMAYNTSAAARVLGHSQCIGHRHKNCMG